MALITIKRCPLGAPGDFMSFNKENLHSALANLTHSELRLYLYFVANKDGYTLPFSKQLIQNTIGLSKNGFYLARDGLMQKGFLTVDDKGNYFFFESASLEKGQGRS